MWDEEPKPVPGDPVAKPTDSAKSGGEAKPKDETAELRKQIEQLTKRQAEIEAESRYWSERAKHGAPEPEPEPEQEADIDDDADEDANTFVDELTTKGIKALTKRGLLTKKAAEQMFVKLARQEAAKAVGHATRRLQSDTELLGAHPDLAKDDTPLAVRTREIFQAKIKRNPALASDADALRESADRAALELEIEQLRSGDRRRRIAEQDGDRDIWGGDEGVSGPSPQQLRFARGFNIDPKRAQEIFRRRA